jgi:hypothetical protein
MAFSTVAIAGAMAAWPRLFVPSGAASPQVQYSRGGEAGGRHVADLEVAQRTADREGMFLLAFLQAAVDTDSIAYDVGRIVGVVLLTAAVGFLARSVARRSAPVRPKAVLLAIVGVVLALTVIGELMLVADLTK